MDENKSYEEKIEYIESRICTEDGKKPYVFISYKSENKPTVFGDIIYRLVHERGLNIYCDMDFESHNDSWLTQFQNNMNDEKCKAIMAFISKEYLTSYACLMELMYSQRRFTTSNKKDSTIPIIFVYLEEDPKVDGETQKQRTNLEKKKSEFDVFFASFDELIDIEKFKPIKHLIDNTKRKVTTKQHCELVINALIDAIDPHKKYYNGSIDKIFDTIKKDIGEEVFSPIDTATNGNSEPKPEPEPKPKLNGIKGKTPLPISNKPEPVITPNPEPNSTGEVYYFVKPNNPHGGLAVIKQNGTDFTLMKYSKVANNSKVKQIERNFLKYINEYKEGVKLVTEDVSGSVSALSKLVYGTSVPNCGNNYISKEEAEKILSENAKLAGLAHTITQTPENGGIDEYEDDIYDDEWDYTDEDEDEDDDALDYDDEDEDDDDWDDWDYTDEDEDEDEDVVEPTVTPPTSGKIVDLKSIIKTGNKIYKFTLYDTTYINSSLKDMVITVFETVLNRNPDKLDIALEKLKANLRKGDIIGKYGQTIDGDKVSTIFKSGKACNINGITVSIGTSMNSDAADRIFIRLCEICDVKMGTEFIH